ncbi:NTP transferase domain-containing protein [Novosphingobium sp.]|uniref:NTP transferase domain-containing protein n=1 Tax=Novosphingobium sp. TaxID=1874826 RepID=UPI001EB22D44|nr:NTP transferase domain-containing protein [Novosphingobium sp.]MBK9011128.1 NTP transferase domain-containing protein [Novosphingobium sp.]
MILGAVLAGGQSSRFGSDKALAELGGETLLARAVATLSGWCDQVVVVGREDAPPHPARLAGPGMGPLGGIAAALHLARDEGYARADLGVDAAGLPEDLPALLAPPRLSGPQPVVGLWPASAAARSRRSCAATAGTRCAPRRSDRRRAVRLGHLPTSTRRPICRRQAGTMMGYERQADFGTPEVRSDTP